MIKITPCLWFDNQGGGSGKLLRVGIFKNSKIGAVSHYGETGQEIHGGKPGAVMTVEFELDGQPFTALNGGPLFKFNEAISFQVDCETQEEVDYYWEKLSEGGDPRGAAVRLAQGQVRRVLAGRPGRDQGDADRQGPRQSRQRR